MSPVLLLLTGLGVYLAVGLVVGLWFVLVGVRRVDQAANAAPLRVRLLFLPGAAGLWPLVMARWRTLKREQESGA